MFFLRRLGGGGLVPGAVEPGEVGGARLLEGFDLVTLLHGEPDVVKAVEQAVLAEGVHVERDLIPAGARDGLRLEVHLELGMGNRL